MRMTPELWRKAKPIFHRALKVPLGGRAQWLADACGSDESLRRELSILLEASEHDRQTLAGPVDDTPTIPEKADRPFDRGRRILRRFEIVRHIGAGGMGDVYEATDLELGRVALKTIRNDIADNTEMIERFKREVQIARKLTGRHVCRIHELFVVEEEGFEKHRAFLTMEFLDGITLTEKIRNAGPVKWQEALAIGLEICDGLQTIHEAGIIHRDLKSRNIMLALRNGVTCVVLMDFGLAREISPVATMNGLTARDVIVGTPAYMAPEQFEGRRLSPATDIYALGVVLYELVTGEYPFATRSTLGPRASRDPRLIPATSIQPGLPRHVDDVISKCLEFDSAQRYQSADEVAEELKGRDSLSAWLRQRKLILRLGVLATVLVFCGLLLVPSCRERLRGIVFSSPEKHIVVLPFEMPDDGSASAALADGLMDSLSGRLSNAITTNKDLWVVPASEVRRRKVSDPGTALREFGATIAIKGRFERNGSETRLALTVIDTKRMAEIGFADVVVEDGDLALLQHASVVQLGRLMNVSLDGEDVTARLEPTNRSAYEDYLSALGYIQRFDKPGNLDRAISLLQNIIKTDPHSTLSLARLSQAFVLRYKLDSDASWLRDAGKYAEEALKLDGRVPLAHTAMAQVQEHTGHTDLAIEEFQHAIDLDPRDVDAISGLAGAYQSLGRYSDAEAAFRKAAALRPEDWSGHNNLGNFYSQLGRFEGAIQEYNRAIELAPDNAGVYSNLGQAYLSSADPKMRAQAEGALKRSIEIMPTYVAYANLGNLYGIEHRFSESSSMTLKALQLNDQDYDVWNNLAEDYEWMGDGANAKTARDKTMKLLKEAIAVNPGDGDGTALEAVLLAKAGERGKAIEKIQEALALSPDSQSSLASVADAYAILGDRPLATIYIRRALSKGLATEQLKSDPYIKEIVETQDLYGVKAY
jgi:serine/threonine protein kinase/tetratricopeptide (TPR) repeat protein